MHFSDAVKEFILYLKIERASSVMTLSSYNSDLRSFNHYIERKNISEVSDITTAVLRQYFVEIQQERELKTNTMCRHINMMRSFFNYIQDQEYIISNPMRKIRAPKKEKSLPIYLNNEEALRYLETPIRIREEWIRKRDRAVLDTLFFTGVRRNELLSLTLDNLNLNEWTLKVVKGKGKKDRLIPLNVKLVKSLKEYLEKRPGKQSALFVSVNFTKKLGATGLYVLFKKHLKRAKITRFGISPHKIRHTYASMILKGSKDLLAVQELLGHTDLSTTRVYLHTTMDDLRKAVERHPFG